MQLELDRHEAKLLAKIVHQELNYTTGDATDEERKMLSGLIRRLLSV